MDKIQVDLQDLEGVYLIVGHPTGVVYSHQCAGHMCNEKELEGYLVPLEYPKPLRKDLERAFGRNSKYKGWCEVIDEEDVEIARQIFVKNKIDWLEINGDKRNQSCEAWLHVQTRTDIEYIPYCHGSTSRTDLVLIWQNSD